MPAVTMTLELANGTQLTAQGTITADSWKTQGNTLDVILIPQDNNWSVFAGSGDISGSIRRVSIAGVTYHVPGDADADHVPTKFQTEGIAHSGGVMLKKTLRVRTTTVTLKVNASEIEALRAIAEAA